MSAAEFPYRLPPELVAVAEEIGRPRVERVYDALARRLGSVVVVAEAVRRRHNASAILRSCEAFGVHEVHLVTEGFRAAPGASRHAERWVRLRTFADTASSLEDLRARGFRVYVADLGEHTCTPETVPVDEPVAIVFGSEFTGVSEAARAAADGVVQIPIHGLTQSLNVSVAAAIIVRAVAERARAARGADLDEEERARFLAEWVETEGKARFGWLFRTAAIERGEEPT